MSGHDGEVPLIMQGKRPSWLDSGIASARLPLFYDKNTSAARDYSGFYLHIGLRGEAPLSVLPSPELLLSNHEAAPFLLLKNNPTRRCLGDSLAKQPRQNVSTVPHGGSQNRLFVKNMPFQSCILFSDIIGVRPTSYQLLVTCSRQE